MVEAYLLLNTGFEGEKFFLAHVALDVFVVGRYACAIDACLLEEGRSASTSRDFSDKTKDGSWPQR